MPASVEKNERGRLEQLSLHLREATLDALANGSALARALDESRGEVERILMLSAIDSSECRRIVIRARMMLDAWQGMAPRLARSQ